MNARQRKLEKIMIELNRYMAQLYKEDLDKFRDRVESFRQLQYLFNQVGTSKKKITDIIIFCDKEIPAFKGKGGRQAYVNLLTQLKTTCTVTMANDDKKLLKTDFRTANSHIKDEADKLFIGHSVVTLRKIKNYIGTIEKEIEQAEKGGLFTKKINIPLSKEKQKIAEDLQIALQNYNKTSGKEEFRSLVKAIVEADYAHQKALEEKGGKPKRLGKLIEEIKSVMEYYAPIEFDTAVQAGAKKHQPKNSVDLY